MERYINNDDVNKAQIVTSLRERALTWYMKYSMSNPNDIFDEVNRPLVSEFKKPKSELQYIRELKEIKKALTESLWELGQ